MISLGRLTKCMSAGSLVLAAGCYELQPAGSNIPQPGQTIGLDINDAGRAALGGSMGPEIDQIEGRLVEHTATEYLVAVTDVHFLRGGEQAWDGENIHVPNGYVATVYERRLSKTKTVAMAAVGVGAVALIVSQGLNGLGDVNRSTGPTPGDTAHTTRRRGPAGFAPHLRITP